MGRKTYRYSSERLGWDVYDYVTCESHFISKEQVESVSSRVFTMDSGKRGQPEVESVSTKKDRIGQLIEEVATMASTITNCTITKL